MFVVGWDEMRFLYELVNGHYTKMPKTFMTGPARNRLKDMSNEFRYALSEKYGPAYKIRKTRKEPPQSLQNGRQGAGGVRDDTDAVLESEGLYKQE